jgi:hypothetical protein
MELRDLIPITNLLVRRRRYDGAACLILDNYYFELDEATDAVWRACDGVRTVGDIALELQRAYGLAPEAASSIAADALNVFFEQKLVHWRDA